MTRSEHDRFARWLTEVGEVVGSIARRRGLSVHDGADVAQTIVLDALGHGDAIMQRYPEPSTYAAVRFRHGHVSWLRHQAVQRAEGALRQRRVESFDPVLHDRVETHDPTVEAVIDRGRSIAVQHVLVDRLGASEAAAVLCVKGLGVPVAEYAESVGVARETASRRVNAAVRLVADDLTAIAA